MNKNVLLLGSVVLIVLAIGLVAILDRTNTPSGETTDVRARAAVTKTLQVNATVTGVDESAGTIAVNDLYLNDENRSGEAKNLGAWTVSAPGSFNFASVTPGTQVIIGVDSSTFSVTKHTLTAVTIIPARQ